MMKAVEVEVKHICTETIQYHQKIVHTYDRDPPNTLPQYNISASSQRNSIQSLFMMSHHNSARVVCQSHSVRETGREAFDEDCWCEVRHIIPDRLGARKLEHDVLVPIVAAFS